MGTEGTWQRDALGPGHMLQVGVSLPRSPRRTAGGFPMAEGDSVGAGQGE